MRSKRCAVQNQEITLNDFIFEEEDEEEENDKEENEEEDEWDFVLLYRLHHWYLMQTFRDCCKDVPELAWQFCI